MVFSPRERAFVQASRVGRLATADADGRPHAVPICFAMVDDRLVSVIDEKPKSVEPRSLRRVRNIEENPAASIIVDRYTDDWDRLGWVRVDGHVSVRGPDDPDHERAIAALRGKYDPYADQRLEDRPFVAVTPGTVVSWGTLSWR